MKKTTSIETLYENKWIEVREKTIDGKGKYVYSHSNWCNGQGVAVLAYRINDGVEFLGRYENCPAHSEDFDLCSITGGMDKVDESAVETAQRELLEEGGYDVPIEKFNYLGQVFPSKQSDNIQHLFIVDITGIEQGEIVGDGTFGEEGAYVEWIDNAKLAESHDPLLQAMYVKGLSYITDSIFDYLG